MPIDTNVNITPEDFQMMLGKKDIELFAAQTLYARAIARIAELEAAAAKPAETPPGA